MKRRYVLWSFVVVSLLLALPAAMAAPISLPCGDDPVEISLFGATSLYQDDGSGVVLNRTPRHHTDPTIAPGDELRSIFYVDAISYLDDEGLTQTAFNQGRDGFEVSGTIHGLEVKNVYALGAFAGKSFFYVEYAPCEDMMVTPLSDPTGIHDEDGEMVPGAGGRATFYTDDSPDFTWDPDREAREAAALANGTPVADGSPDEWVEGVDYANERRLDFGTAGAFNADGVSEMGGDVDVLFDGTFIPLIQYGLTDDPEVVMTAMFTYSPIAGTMTGTAEAFLNSIRDGEGSEANAAARYTSDSPAGSIVPSGIVEFMDLPNAEDSGGDFHMQMDIGWLNARQPRLVQMGESGWSFSANDPVNFINSPEPCSAVILGLPLVALVRRVVRRRKRT